MIDWCKSSQVSNRTAVEVFFFFTNAEKCAESCDDRIIKGYLPVCQLQNRIDCHTVHTKYKHKCVCCQALSADWLLRSSLLSSYSFIGKMTPQCLTLNKQTVFWGHSCSGGMAKRAINKTSPRTGMCHASSALSYHLLDKKNYNLVAVDNYSRSPFNTSRPGP